MGTLRVCIALSILFCGSCTCARAEERWRTFKSTNQHFSVRYPPSWDRLGNDSDLGPDPNCLEILNFPDSERLTGVIIKESGAAIRVFHGPPDPSALTGLEASARRERDIPIAGAPQNGCRSLKEVIWHEDVGGGGGRAYQVYSDYYCRTRCGVFGVFLMNWQGDPKQEELQALAQRIAMTLRACERE